MKAGAGRKILETAVKVSGAVARSIIGLAAVALLLIPFRKGRAKKR